MKGYTAQIEFCTKELSVIEKIKLTNITSAMKIDDIFNSGETELFIDVDFAYNVLVHNEKSEDKEYNKFVIVDKSGSRYVTGSESLIDEFTNIFDQLENAGMADEMKIRIYTMESKNYKGKNFYTCELV